jgi:hypothetical protein
VEGVKESFIETNNQLEVEGAEGVNGDDEGSDSDNDVLSSLVQASADSNSNIWLRLNITNRQRQMLWLREREKDQRDLSIRKIGDWDK